MHLIEALFLFKLWELQHSLIEKGKSSNIFQPNNRKKMVVPFDKKDLPEETLLEILRQTDISKEDPKK